MCTGYLLDADMSDAYVDADMLDAYIDADIRYLAYIHHFEA